MLTLPGLLLTVKQYITGSFAFHCAEGKQAAVSTADQHASKTMQRAPGKYLGSHLSNVVQPVHHVIQQLQLILSQAAQEQGSWSSA